VPTLDDLSPEELQAAYTLLSERVHQLTMAQELIRAKQQNSTVDAEKHQTLDNVGQEYLDLAIAGATEKAKQIADEAARQRALEEADRLAAEQQAKVDEAQQLIADRILTDLSPEEREAVERVMRR
jgi:hypothetical protein